MKNVCLAVLLILLFACNQSPKINQGIPVDTTSVADDRLTDTTKIMVASLPMKFDSTDVTIFAVSLVELESRRGYVKDEYGSSYSSGSGATFYSSGDYIDGNFINLIFRDNQGLERKLTDMKATFDQAKFLRELFQTTGAGYILYYIYDRDTNGDKAYNYNDLRALYISKLNGTGFTKLSEELHDFHDDVFIKEDMKYYFRTLEDRNKDGLLNSKDIFHHYVVSFDKNGYTLSEYDPLSVFKK
jgi:hypothetical protein